MKFKDLSCGVFALVKGLEDVAVVHGLGDAY